jgi:hypothetical protein
MHEKAWEAVERDEARPIPTAPVGKNIQWYIAGDRKNVVPGIVQAVEGVGRLKIKVFPLNSMPQEKQGVYHINHPVHEQLNNPTTYQRGSWDFVPGDAVLDEFFAEFREDIKRRKDNLVLAEKAAKKAEAEFKERQVELATGKKHKRDILPAPTK